MTKFVYLNQIQDVVTSIVLEFFFFFYFGFFTNIMMYKSSKLYLI